jgi:3-hydroxyisobutyrate dehydrogenase-like beta-hydroxyacid dehydrogenase
MSQKPRIGFLGVGTMGGPMAANLLKAGFDLTVFDLSAERVALLTRQGARAARTPRECAAAGGVFITSLPGPKQIEAASGGDDGFLVGLRPGSLWIDTTTNDMALVRRLGDELAARGVEMADAPVTGAVDGAIQGKLTLFIGGAPAIVAKALPILAHLGRVIPAGGLGAGTVVKLVTNQLWFTHAAVIGEGLALGAKAGVDLLTLWEAIKASVGDSFVARHDVPSIFAGHYDPSFSLALCLKDLGLIADLGQRLGVPLPMSEAARDRFALAAERYGADKAELHVAKLIEEGGQIELRAAGDWQPHWEVKA